VFQSYALYPHLSVYDNIAFGPKLRKEAQASYQPRIEAAARMLNLTPLLERLPRALSGGQRQRVAMGRAIVREPKLFLFDEPLSNLDAKLRVQMRTEIKALHQRLRNTIIYVTHDQVEAMTMADRIVVMNAGRIEQVGAPLALYDRPANLFVAGFIGSPGMNFIEGTVIVGALHCADGTVLPLPGPLPALGRRITLGIRPEHIDIVDGAGIAARALVIEPTGAETYVYAKTGSNPICIAAARRLGVAPGQEIALAFAPERLHFFDSATGARIVL
jgi:multiple sugar transport system ATP-binding protein